MTMRPSSDDARGEEIAFCLENSLLLPKS